jgi:hypothetical protein
MFNTETQEVSILNTSLPKGIQGMGCAYWSSTVYLFGGRTDPSSTPLNEIGIFNELSTEIPTQPNKLLIEVGDNTNTFELLPNIELGANGVYFDNPTGSRIKVPAAVYKNGAWTEI